MKLIESSYKIIPQEPGLKGAYKQIELAARTCYKSEDKIEEGSAKKMVDSLVKRGHYSPLEHGTIYLKFSYSSPMYDRDYLKLMDIRVFYQRNKYSKVITHTEDNFKIDVYITTNARVIYENDRHSDLQYMCEPTDYHEKRHTVRFICSRSISHEIVRHRVMSFCQESQRYVNYSLDKFGNDITFIIPKKIKDTINDLADTYDPIEQTRRDWLVNMPLEEAIRDYAVALDGGIMRWFNNLKQNEADYMFLVNEHGWKPQEARSVLPNDCKTEIVVTGFESDWKHFFKLRTSNAAHPDIRSITVPLEIELMKLF